MAHLSLTTATYAAADTLLNGRNSRIIGHNTTLHRTAGDIAVRYHSTDIVTLSSDGWLTVDTGGWYTVTTWQRINALLPAPYRIASDRGTSWLYASGHKVTPYVDGLQVHVGYSSGSANGSVGYAGAVLLSAEDVAGIIAAAEAAAEARSIKRAARLLAQHPEARTFSPDASGLFGQYDSGPGGPHRTYDGASPYCATCATERETWRALRRDALARSHDGLTLTTRNGSDTADVVSTYPAHATLAPEYYGGNGCPWDCPNR